MELLRNYFPELSSHQLDRFKVLLEVYPTLNDRTNVISRRDIDELLLHHVLHSLAIAKFIQFQKGATVLDAGTGGGFPGIPLAIMFPETQFVLNDAILRKIRVVEKAISVIGLSNVVAVHGRMEKMKGPFDFVISRAVADMGWFFPRVRKSISKESQHSIPNGVIYLKGGNLRKELEAYPEAQIESISQWFDEEFFETKKVVYLGLKA